MYERLHKEKIMKRNKLWIKTMSLILMGEREDEFLKSKLISYLKQSPRKTLGLYKADPNNFINNFLKVSSITF
jgi:hypothetical protein